MSRSAHLHQSAACGELVLSWQIQAGIDQQWLVAAGGHAGA